MVGGIIIVAFDFPPVASGYRGGELIVILTLSLEDGIRCEDVPEISLVETWSNCRTRIAPLGGDMRGLYAERVGLRGRFRHIATRRLVASGITSIVVLRRLKRRSQ